VSTLISVTVTGETSLQGYLAVDATVNNRSYGGVRMAGENSGSTDDRNQAPDLSPIASTIQ
jgi:hypothetical protein